MPLCVRPISVPYLTLPPPSAQVYTPSIDLDKVDAILRDKFTLRRAKIGGDGTSAYDGEARSRATPP